MLIWIIDRLEPHQVKTTPVDGLLVVGLTQWDAEERQNVNPVPKGAGVRHEHQHVCEEIVHEIVLDFFVKVPIP
jgi:hypothetical protein